VTGDLGGGRSARPADANDQLASLNLAIEELAKVEPELASALTRATSVIASEVLRNKRLAAALTAVLNQQAPSGSGGLRGGSSSRRPRRSVGPWDPFAVYAEQGEEALRERLAALDLEQLRDIIAEHGMDTDRLAMKWRDPSRLVNRIVERVIDRAAKGDAFRAAPDR